MHDLNLILRKGLDRNPNGRTFYNVRVMEVKARQKNCHGLKEGRREENRLKVHDNCWTLI